MKPTSKRTSCNFIRWKQKSVELLSLQQLRLCSLNKKLHKSHCYNWSIFQLRRQWVGPMPKEKMSTLCIFGNIISMLWNCPCARLLRISVGKLTVKPHGTQPIQSFEEDSRNSVKITMKMGPMANGTAKISLVIHLQCCQNKSRAEGITTSIITSYSFLLRMKYNEKNVSLWIIQC